MNEHELKKLSKKATSEQLHRTWPSFCVAAMSFFDDTESFLAQFCQICTSYSPRQTRVSSCLSALVFLAYFCRAFQASFNLGALLWWYLLVGSQARTIMAISCSDMLVRDPPPLPQEWVGLGSIRTHINRSPHQFYSVPLLVFSSLVLRILN